MTSKFDELVAKLTEIFQIDKPELDFGVYKILHARADEIKDFLTNKLKARVQATLQSHGNATAQAAFDAAKNAVVTNFGAAAIKPDGALDPLYAASPLGQKYAEARQALAAAAGTLQNESVVYSHLLTFFGRYYEDGDFISKRRYKDGVYAIPYSGEEVKLHWANADQYYTKSGENFTNYSFTLDGGAKVHFVLVSAETAKDNIKDNDAVRRFVLFDPAKQVEDGAGEGRAREGRALSRPDDGNTDAGEGRALSRPDDADIADATERVPPFCADATERVPPFRADATERVPPFCADATERVPPERKCPSKNSVLVTRDRAIILFVTVNANHRQEVFANDAAVACIRAAWQVARNWLVGRYVIMPDHIHFFCAPGTSPVADFHRWMAYWKSLVAKSFPIAHDLPLWQRQCWDVQMRTVEGYREKWNYMRNNPVRKGLAVSADDWPYQGYENVLQWHD